MQPILLVLAILSQSVFAEAKICAGVPDAAEKLASERMTKFEKAYVNATMPVFFVGLWSRIDERNRRRLSTVLSQKGNDEMIRGLQDVMSSISARLSEDRHELVTWVTSNHLEKEIEVQSIPVDGSFLLVKATRPGLVAMTCAASAGSLPAILTELGF